MVVLGGLLIFEAWGLSDEFDLNGQTDQCGYPFDNTSKRLLLISPTLHAFYVEHVQIGDVRRLVD
jgi:hypothetical protein